MRLTTLATSIIGLFALILPDTSQALVVDNFNSGDDGVVSTALPGPSNTASGDAIGGSRTLEILSGSGLATSLEVATGELNHGQSGVSAGSSKVTWDDDGVGLSGLDLTEGGLSNGILLDVVSIDVGSVDLTFMIGDTGGGSSSLLLTGLGAGQSSFFFSDFSPGADFTDADVIMLTIEAAANSDVSLDLIESIDVPPPSVPEPSANLLMVIGAALCLGCNGVSRRFRRR